MLQIMLDGVVIFLTKNQPIVYGTGEYLKYAYIFFISNFYFIIHILKQRLASQSFSIFFPTIAIFIPCLCIGGCYLRIFLYVKEKKTLALSDSKNKISKKSVKIAKSLFASFALFAFCWMPYGLVIASDFRDKYPLIVHAWTTFMAHVNSTLNPVFYVLLNSAFRLSFIKLFTSRNFSKNTPIGVKSEKFSTLIC